MGNAYAVIMAGGSGTRLWPLSRKHRPKPLIHLVEKERTMVQIAVRRLHPLFTPDRILLVANKQLTPLLRDQIPEVPEENFIVEPEGRDTAPAVGLAAIHVRHRDPEGVMVVLTADHHIADEETFRNALAVAIDTAQKGGVVTLGIKASYPSTGFGYIERGELWKTENGLDIFALKQFHEKPDQATAEEYIASGNYSWNSGMFIWPVDRVMAEFERNVPDLHRSLEQLAAVIGQPAYEETIARVWPDMPRISVDYALIEKIDREAYVIPVEMGWADIGNFGTLYDLLSSYEGENVTNSDEAPLLIDANRTLIFSNRLVAVLGLEDLVIVDTDDILLVCDYNRAQDVKKLVEQLKKEKRDRYL
jgi:mannose-1-phosphate guanylyltransferase